MGTINHRGESWCSNSRPRNGEVYQLDTCGLVNLQSGALFCWLSWFTSSNLVTIGEFYGYGMQLFIHSWMWSIQQATLLTIHLLEQSTCSCGAINQFWPWDEITPAAGRLYIT
jgi:hypothetical protein